MQSDTSVKRSLSKRIREDIEQAIMSGGLQAGTRLDEQTLCARFTVSRTPVREALIQLAALGLVTMRPRRGAVVAAASLKDRMGLLEMLVPLESLAVRLATRRMDDHERDRLRIAFAQCQAAADARDAERYRIADIDFHEVLSASGRNAILSAQIRHTRARLSAMNDAHYQHPAHMRSSLQDHAIILEAVLNGDELSASEAMGRHVASGGLIHSDMIAREA